MAAIDDLMKALETNPDLRAKMSAAASSLDAVPSAAAAVFNVTADELMEAYKSQVFILSDEELSAVTGGKSAKVAPSDGKDD